MYMYVYTRTCTCTYSINEARQVLTALKQAVSHIWRVAHPTENSLWPGVILPAASCTGHIRLQRDRRHRKNGIRHPVPVLHYINCRYTYSTIVNPNTYMYMYMFGVFGGLITPVCSLILSWSLPVNQDYFEMLCLALP